MICYQHIKIENYRRDVLSCQVLLGKITSLADWLHSKYLVPNLNGPIFLHLAQSPLCKDNFKYLLTFFFLPFHFKLMTLFPTSPRVETTSVYHISTFHPRITKLSELGPILSSFLFQWGKYLIPPHMLWTPSTFLEYFRNLLSLPSLVFNISHSIGLFLPTKIFINLSYLAVVGGLYFPITHIPL